MQAYLSTRMKISIARLIYRFLRVFIATDSVKVTRAGINYALDLSEGIDLAIFLMGSFQPQIFTNSRIILPEASYILDVGANIGSMSLSFASRFTSARIISFEPTDFAATKFTRNMMLNPHFAERIELVRMFVSDRSDSQTDMKAYASWNVGNIVDKTGRHPVHCGKVESSEGVPVTTLDSFCMERQLDGLGLIKIDTDGHEYKVLAGAREVIARYRPYVVFEVGQYIMTEEGISFDWYLEYFNTLGYKLFNVGNNKMITHSNWKQVIPKFGTLDVLSVPQE